MRAHFNRFTEGGGVGVLIGIGLWIQQGGLSIPSPTPPLYWLGVALMVVGAGLGIYGWFGKPFKESKSLDEIKDLLVEIDTCERNAAAKKAKQSHSRDIAKRITKDTIDVFSSSMPTKLRDLDIDYAVHLFSNLSNILDLEDYGLKSELLGTEPYETLNADLTKKITSLRISQKKKDLIERNIDRISALTYGGNSSIIHKGIIKSLPEARKLPTIMLIRIERVDTAMRKLLPKLLDNLNKEWRWKVNLNEPDNL